MALIDKLSDSKAKRGIREHNATTLLEIWSIKDRRKLTDS